jgi:hypothetical protein
MDVCFSLGSQSHAEEEEDRREKKRAVAVVCFVIFHSFFGNLSPKIPNYIVLNWCEKTTQQFVFKSEIFLTTL